MLYFGNCETFKTGLYKPHTIRIDSVYVSIIYTDKQNYIQNMNLYAIATDTRENKYEIYKSKTGTLAFPVNPEKISGFFPWL